VGQVAVVTLFVVFVVVPLVGAFFIDISNALIIQFFLDWI
jgi:sodium--glutamate symport carrier gltS